MEEEELQSGGTFLVSEVLDGTSDKLIAPEDEANATHGPVAVV